nr:MAG TPA: Putative alpha-ribazole-5'-phosphate phosphatase CobC, PSI-2, NYSGXRC, STRUCTURAL GENOMICS [Caudoviricetes sp.]
MTFTQTKSNIIIVFFIVPFIRCKQTALFLL